MNRRINLIKIFSFLEPTSSQDFYLGSHPDGKWDYLTQSDPIYPTKAKKDTHLQYLKDSKVKKSKESLFLEDVKRTVIMHAKTLINAGIVGFIPQYGFNSCSKKMKI